MASPMSSWWARTREVSETHLPRRIRTVPVDRAVPTCTICADVIVLARRVHAPYILEAASAVDIQGSAWSPFHFIRPVRDEIKERTVSCEEYWKLRDSLTTSSLGA